MTLNEALDVVVARTKHERYHWLCSDENPDSVQREAYRSHVMSLAGEPAKYPPLLSQVGNAIKSAVEFVGSGFQVATREEVDRRLAICHGCPNFNAEQHRCQKCGCFIDIKTLASSSRCPENLW